MKQLKMINILLGLSSISIEILGFITSNLTLKIIGLILLIISSIGFIVRGIKTGKRHIKQQANMKFYDPSLTTEKYGAPQAGSRNAVGIGSDLRFPTKK